MENEEYSCIESTTLYALFSSFILNSSLGEGSSLRRIKSKRPRLQHVWRHAFNTTQAEPTPSGVVLNRQRSMPFFILNSPFSILNSLDGLD
jgi:hypothetical protein